MTIEIIISELDFKIIRKFRELRINAGLTQQELSARVGVSESFFGNVENPKQPQKLNLRMLGRVSYVLDLDSYLDILPEKIVSNDLVRIKLKLLKINKRKEKDSNGNPIKNMEIMAITSLTEKEVIDYTNSKDKNKFLKICSK